EENKKILGSPVELVGLERLNPVEQAFVLSRLLFKVTEAEWMLSLSEEGKERLLNAEEKYVVAGVREADVVRIHKVVGDLTQKENSSRNSLEHAVAVDTTDKSQAFTKNILVAIRVNPIRAWRYLSELELTKLMPALCHLSRPECQDIWWKEVRF